MCSPKIILASLVLIGLSPFDKAAGDRISSSNDEGGNCFFTISGSAPPRPSITAGKANQSLPLSYTVVGGDTLWAIALKMYPGADPTIGCKMIRDANRETLGRGNVKLGQILIIPPNDVSAGTVSVKSSQPILENSGIDFLRQSAEAGNANSQFILGASYRFGNGVSIDLDTALKWFRSAAEQGNADAQFEVGLCYATGTAVPSDMKIAVKWYLASAIQGQAYAQFSLGSCYFYGNGVKRDQSEAVKWYRRCADQGMPLAQYSLGLCYLKGLGVRNDTNAAAVWFQKSADKGFASAQTALAESYLKGSGVEKNAAHAVDWFEKAAIQGDPSAEVELGECLIQGAGTRVDAPKAAMWFCKSAEQGNPQGQLHLAGLYLKGEGVIKNEVEGAAWIYVAAASGNKMGLQGISVIENNLSSAAILPARRRAVEIQTQIGVDSAKDSTASIPQIPIPNSPKASGSGAFITTNGFVITAAHVVQGAARIEIVTSRGTFSATVVRTDSTNDVALLKCAGNTFTPLPIVSPNNARAGTAVFTVGFPNIQFQGFNPKFTRGEISSVTGIQDDPRQWQISVPIQPGNSGGPLCDEKGNLIGIVEATLDPLTMAKLSGEIPQNVNYAIKGSYILPLLNDVQNLPSPLADLPGNKFEDIVASTQKSAVLVLVY